jgi:ribosomal protein S21
MATHVEVNVNEKNRDQDAAVEKMIRLFNKKYRESEILYEIRDNTHYKKPSDVRRKLKSKQKRINEIYKLIRKGKIKAKNKHLQQEIMNS